MRKKVTLFLILALCVLLTLSLVACNYRQIDKLPDEIGAGDVNGNKSNGNINAYLKFSMPKAVSSVFSSIYSDEFDMSDVEYSIVYTDGSSTTVVNGGNLSDAMVTKVVDNSTNQDVLQDLGSPIVWRKGHYMVFVSVTLSNGGKAEGSFALHLKDRYKETEQVTLTFDLNNDKATAYFGTFKDGKGTVKVDKDITFASWDDFTDTFRMVCDGMALSSVTYGNNTLSATKGFDGGFKITSDMSFKANWTNNVITAKLLLNEPADATVQYGKSNPVLESAEGAKLATQSVVRGTGKIQAPVVDKFNVFNGYYFAGWYLDNDGNEKYSEGDTLWSFSQSVGSADITLVARWTERSYSFTLYTMGGVYPQGVTGSLNIQSDEDVPKDYTLVDATSRFGLENHALNRIIVGGLAYGVDYSKYIVKVVAFESTTDEQIKANTRYFTFADLTAKLVKGSEDYVAYSGIYRDYQCTEPAKVDKVESDETGKIDDIGYIKWTFKEIEGESAGARLERMSGYYTDVVFKDCLTVKADGSIRIDKIADDSISELIIPATLIVNGKESPVTEISAKSCMNLKALLKIDMSEASNLTTIGEQAFAHCPALSEVEFPANSAITELGKNVFYRSRFENEYKEKHDTDYFIVNDVLYKYVGTGVDAGGEAVTSIDLTSLTQVKTISDGAFANHTEIKSVTLGDGVKRINNGAFAGCTDLDTFIVSENSQLAYIGETAFDGCSKLLSSSSNVYATETIKGNVVDYKAIIIGRVYYRFLDATATSAIIPTNSANAIHVNHIATNAFKNCKDIATVTIDYPKEILSIGKDAFSDTLWIKSGDGFTIVNNILTNYYSGTVGVESDIIVPSSVKVINEYAFGTFANQVATIQLGDTVEKIENYAFAGASSLVSLILHKVGVDTVLNKLTGAPEIEGYAFSNNKGKLLDTVRFFFREEVINFLEAHKDSGDVTDSATIGWIRLYKQYRSRFITEDIKAVWIADNAMSHLVLRKDSNQSAIDAIRSLYGSSIEKALVVTSNTEVVRYEDLDITANAVSATLITKANYPDLYEEGVNKYILTFKYDGSDKGCHNTPADGNAFIVTIVDAIDSNETSSFYETKIDKYTQNGTVINANGKTSSDAFWLEGFEGDIEGEPVPTFYTSTEADSVKVTFAYKDIAGNIHRIAVKSIKDFNTATEKPGEAKFTVDFHGIGTYVFSVDYNVKESQYIAIEQIGAMAIPINGDPVNYFKYFNVNMVGQDGSNTLKSLNTTQDFEVVEVDGVKTSKIDTATLGLHTLKITYSRTDAANDLTQIITYSVVLEADASLFQYETDDISMTARIVGCLASAKSMETIVLPATYTKNGVVYTVTQIGDIQSTHGVFEGYTKLKAIYLGRNIVKIGTNSFSGCTALEHIYTAQRVDDDTATLNKDNFDVISTVETDNDTIKYVSVGNLQGVEYSGVLVIGAQYMTEATEGAKRIVYKVVGIGEGVTVNAGTEVFLPDTVYKYNAIQYASTVEGEEGAEVVPYVYTSANGIKFKTVGYVSESVEYIGNGAFLGCSSLKSIDLSRATKLNYIGANAFEGTGLESIDLSKNTLLQSIDAKVFFGCTKLTTVVVSSSLKNIGNRAFGGCTELMNFTFSDTNGLEKVEEAAFEGCTKDGFVAPTKA